MTNGYSAKAPKESAVDKHLKKQAKDQTGAENNSQDKEKETIAERLLATATEKTISFFKDQFERPYGQISVNSHVETISLDCKRYRYWLRGEYYKDKHEVVGREALTAVIEQLQAKAFYDSPIVGLNLRVAWDEIDKVLLYDMTDPEWRWIKVTQERWNIEKQSKPIFHRFNRKTQIEPSREYPPDIYEQYLDLYHIYGYEKRLLQKAWTITAYIPDISHVIDEIHGEPGSVKSTYAKSRKALIDPSPLETLTIPKDRNEFIQQLYHNYAPIYDNVSEIPYWFSDEACNAATGNATSKRTLYTDDDDFLYSYRRALTLIGINPVLVKPDAQDRTIMTEFDRLRKDQRTTETKANKRFAQLKPLLLGYIFDTLVKTLQIKEEVENEIEGKLERMGDYCVWAEAAARAMGYPPLAFLNAYYNVIGRKDVEIIENTPLGKSIVKLTETITASTAVAQADRWEMSLKEFMERLNETALGLGIDITEKSWPKKENVLSRRLKPIMSSLREGYGIDLKIDRYTTGEHKNTAYIILKTSPLSPPTPPAENQAQLPIEQSGDSADRIHDISTFDNISPPESTQIHAQSKDSGDSGGISRTTLKEDK